MFAYEQLAEEGFLDVSHFAFVHVGTFGELDNREVPSYPVELTPAGFRADYISTVSNYSTAFKHLNPPGFKWRRLFETWLLHVAPGAEPSTVSLV